MKDWLTSLAFWLVPVLCSCIYLPCITYSEWYIDELFAVLRNADARGETPWREVFKNDFWGNPLNGGSGSWTHKSYRPLCVFSYRLQFWLLGGDLFRPQPLRAFNVALHATNTLLLFALLRNGLSFSKHWSCLAACLFALHPVHAENVVYLVGRADMLATTGWLLTSVLYLRFHSRRFRGTSTALLPITTGLLLAFAVVLTIIAGLCKESGLTLLVFLAGVELCSLQKPPHRGPVAAVCTLVAFALVATVRFWITQGTSAPFGFVDTPVQFQTNKSARTWTYMYHHAFYAKLLALPGELSWDYSYNAIPMLQEGWRDGRAMLVCVAYLTVASLASWSLSGKGSRRVLTGLQVVIVPFVPASNLFFTVGVTIGERLLYPSTVGAALVLAGLGEFCERSPLRAADRGAQVRPGRGRASPALATLVLLFVYTWRCGVRVRQWRSSDALYKADVQAWPGSVKNQHQVATVYHAQGRHEEALKHYNASLMILDDNALTDHCIAQIYIETGRYQLAVQRFEKIMRGHGVGFAPFNLWMLYVDYGFALVAMSSFAEAVPMLQHGLQRNLAVPHGLNALGYAHAHLDQLQDAQDKLAKGLEYDPENGILWNNLAVVWMLGGVLQQAVQGLERALHLEPNHPSFLHNALLLQRAADNGGMLDATPKLELFFTRAT